MDEIFDGKVEVEVPKNDPLAECEKKIDERDRTILNALHVSKELTFDRKIMMSGDKINDVRGGKVYLSVGDKRINELPKARTKKGDLSRFGQQEVLDAAVALANIVEIVAPYAWEEGKKKAQEKAIPIELGHGLVARDPNPERYAYPAEALKSMSKESPGWNLLVSEVASFVDRFGLLHMSSSERRWDYDSWLFHKPVVFYGGDDPLTLENFEADWKRRLESEIRREVCVLLNEKAYEEADSVGDEAVREKYQSVIAKIESECDYSYAPEDIQEEARVLVIDREKRALEPFVRTSEELYALHLSRFVKSFKGFSDYDELWKDELERLRSIEEELKPLENKWSRVPYWEDEDEDEEQAKKREAKIRELHKKRSSVLKKLFHDLQEASREAANAFDDKAKENLVKYGTWEVNLYNFYNCSLLVHDALEMLRAIDGDESAFRRILPRFHMERFQPRGEEDFVGYTLWFESIGDDADNPWPYDEKYTYDALVDWREVKLVRRSSSREMQTFGGTDWLYYRLCDSADGLDNFERLVRKHLPFFVKKMISDGKNRRNYKGHFAPGAKTSDSLVYTVNDRDCDLMAIIWSALDLVRTKDVELNLSKCEICGRFVRIKKQQRGGKRRKTCSDACRQSLSRGKVDEKATKLRDDFNAFIESGAEIKIGVDEPPKESSSTGPLDVFNSIVNAIFQRQHR